jgi:NAD(P)-dependent dehydrogenase (short-subunit alcohol dehydrogenase family)
MISDSAKLREIADTLTKAANIAVRVFSADLRDPAEPGQAIAQAVGHFGRLDPPVNNAGASRHADLFARTDEDWQDGFAMKFHGNVSVTRAAGPHSRCSNGSIVNRA